MTTSKKEDAPGKQTNQNTQINEKDKTIDPLTSEKSQLTSDIETKNEEIKKLTSEMKSIKLNNKGLVVTISIIIVFFSFLLFIEYKELKVKEASLGTNTLLDSLNF